MMTQKARQTREETILHHRERLNAVLLHIQENLDASLTIEALSAIAGFSLSTFIVSLPPICRRR